MVRSLLLPLFLLATLPAAFAGDPAKKCPVSKKEGEATKFTLTDCAFNAMQCKFEVAIDAARGLTNDDATGQCVEDCNYEIDNECKLTKDGKKALCCCFMGPADCDANIKEKFAELDTKLKALLGDQTEIEITDANMNKVKEVMVGASKGNKLSFGAQKAMATFATNNATGSVFNPQPAVPNTTDDEGNTINGGQNNTNTQNNANTNNGGGNSTDTNNGSESGATSLPSAGGEGSSGGDATTRAPTSPAAATTAAALTLAAVAALF